MMDASTADALSALLTSSEVHHVMVVAVFRDGEVGPSRAVSRLREKVGQTPGIVHELEMKPLDEPAVAHLVAASLHVSVAEATELAALIHEKTAGNPFFIGELLASLHREAILQLDWEQGRWRYDIERARACQASDNVGALMAERIERMSPPARELLAAASCFGISSSSPPFARYSSSNQKRPRRCSGKRRPSNWCCRQPSLSKSEVPAGWLAISFNTRAFVRPLTPGFPTPNEFAFTGASVSDLDRSQQRYEPRPLFDILHHLNLGRSLLTEPRERLDLAELNLKATQRALRTAAFAIAENHAEIATGLVAAAERALHPGLAFRVSFAHAEATYLAGDPVRAEALCQDVFALATSNLSRAGVHVLRTRIIEHLGRLPDAVIEIRSGLALLGVRLPEAPAEIDEGIGAGIAKMQAHLSRHQVEDLANLPGSRKWRDRHGARPFDAGRASRDSDLSAPIYFGGADDVRYRPDKRCNAGLVQELRRLRHHSSLDFGQPRCRLSARPRRVQVARALRTHASRVVGQFRVWRIRIALEGSLSRRDRSVRTCHPARDRARRYPARFVCSGASLSSFDLRASRSPTARASTPKPWLT